MTAGPLHPDNFPAGRDRSLGKGHGTESLGPSDVPDLEQIPDLDEEDEEGAPRRRRH